MSGHSKWATTKHKKAANDAKRAKLWAKLIRNIEVAAGTGNFANAPLEIGRYAASNYFNGRLYQLVIAGKQASAAEITNTETFINQKTGAY